MLGMLRAALRTSSLGGSSSKAQLLRNFSKHVFPSFVGDSHSIKLSDGRKEIQIRMRRPDRTKLMSGFWQHKLLSPSLWALGLQNRRKSDAIIDGEAVDDPRPPRKMSDSYCEVRLPFRTEPKLLEDYSSIYGGIRVGKLLEDLDVLAASIAYLHCDDLDLTIVTAAVDRIDLVLPIDTIVSDVRLRGSVTYVGRSSIEVTLSVETDQSSAESWELAALAKFILVARSPNGDQSVEVNRLKLENQREKEIFAAGQERHQYRLRRSASSLFKMPPNEEEIKVVHDICMSQELKPISDELPSSKLQLIPMESTKRSSLKICHPQDRNIHNFIFGGYLCREAFELAFATAYIFMGGKRPSLKTIDDIAFVHPVPIGSLVDFSSEIVHSRIHEGLLYACVQVVADVIQPSSNTRLTTNTFHFTLTHPIEAFSGGVPSVLPKTYLEAMKYLEGKRRVDFDLSIPLSHSSSASHYEPAQNQ